MNIAGTALSLLNFSSEIVYKYQIVFLDKPETYNLLKLLILKGFEKYYDLKVEKPPSLFQLRNILISLYKIRNTKQTHLFFEAFFSHLFVYEELDHVPPTLIKINTRIYVLAESTDSGIISPITQQEAPYLFAKLNEPVALPGFLWSDSIKKVTKYKGQASLLLPQIPDTEENNIIEQFSDFYKILITAYHEFIFCPEQESSKQEIYEYITTMSSFFYVNK